MVNAGRIAIFIEGKKREPKYFSALKERFFPGQEVDLLCLPTCGTIYALWKQMAADAFQTDLIEVVRERGGVAAKKLDGKTRDSFQEIYLFYDFDPQQGVLGNAADPDMEAVLRDMMATFDNETELGKLYISYPMVEALRDIQTWSCEPHYRCRVPLQDLQMHIYKQYSCQANSRTGSKSHYEHVNHYDDETWRMILAIFLTRCGCLFSPVLKTESLYAWYKEALSPMVILEKELEIYKNEKEVFVLSAFPEWLLDYFKPEWWNSLVEDLPRVRQPACAKETVSPYMAEK